MVPLLDLAADEGGGFVGAVPCLLAVEAVSKLLAMGVVAEGTYPWDWNQSASSIVHLRWPAMLSDERLSLRSTRWWSRLGGTRPFARVLAAFVARALAFAFGRDQVDVDTLGRRLAPKLPKFWRDVVQLLLGLVGLRRTPVAAALAPRWPSKC